MKPHTIGKQMLSLFALAGILLLAGCDYFHNYDYRIKNDTGKTLKVYFRANMLKSDSLVVILPDTDTAIYRSGRMGRAYDHETNENLVMITTLDVFKCDTIKNVTNFLRRDRWTYTKVDDGLASYSVTITDADF